MTKKSGTNSTPKKKILATRTDQLPVPLTEPEIREAGKQLAHLEGDLAAQTASEKDIKDGLKAKRSALEMRISLLANTIRAGLEYRPIPVRVEADYEENVVRDIREDTGEAITTRPMNAQDRQVTLFTGQPADKKPAPEQLDWREEGVNLTAAIATGTYCIEPDDTPEGGNRVCWTPAKGKSKSLGKAESEDDGIKLAEQHYLAQAADAILGNAGAGKLTEKEAR